MGQIEMEKPGASGSLLGGNQHSVLAALPDAAGSGDVSPRVVGAEPARDAVFTTVAAGVSSAGCGTAGGCVEAAVGAGLRAERAEAV